MRVAYHRHWFLPAMGGLLVFAWVTLWLWSESPYGRYLDHGDWTRTGVAGVICSAVPAGETLVPAFLYAGGWVLMLVAMMLPTALPLLEVYRHLTRRRADRYLLLALVIAGYLAVWLCFGMLAHLADLGVHAVVSGSPWLVVNGWSVGAAVLAVAGAFQFSALKYRCLDRCRTTLSFIMEHWQGRRERARAFGLGWRHGLYCVGCCWALMLLMFVVGTGNVGWMLLLGAVMAIEKNSPWGRALRAPLGIGLMLWSLGIVAWNLGTIGSLG